MERVVVGLPGKGWDIGVGEGGNELVGGWNGGHAGRWGGARRWPERGWEGCGFAVIVVFKIKNGRRFSYLC